MQELIDSIIDLINVWSQSILPEDTATAILEASRDVFVRFYWLAVEYIEVLM